jgi:methylmalonyl-CoA mutase cobalamin-binding subunit
MPVSRCQRRSVVVFVGDDRVSDDGAKALAGSLGKCGVVALYVGRINDASRIAAAAQGAGADAVEVCVAGPSAGVHLLCELLRELRRIGRGGVGVVVHRIQ